MTSQALLKDIQAKLLGVELELDLIEQNIEAIDSDINFLFLMEDETVYNINILKKVGVVADLKSYRQSWVKLANIRTKTQELKGKRIQLDRELDAKVKAKEFYDNEWERLHRIMEDDRVILVFKKRDYETRDI